MGVLKAKVAGNWVPLEFSGGPNPQNALGIVAMGSLAASPFNITAGTQMQVTGNVSYTMLVGRRYRVAFAVRAIQSLSTLTHIQVFLRDSTTSMFGTEHPIATAPATGTVFNPLIYQWTFDGDGVARAWNVALYATTVHCMAWTTASHFFIEDIGPNAAPALPVPATPQAWTPLPFAANWNDLGAVYSCQYRKIGDVVSLRGLAARRNSIANTITEIARLPAGFYTPGRYSYWTVNRGDVNTAGQLEIRTAGEIMYNGTAPFAALPINGWVSLETVTFSVMP